MFPDLRRKLQGKPDEVLTVLLLLLAGAIVVTAFIAPPELKGAVAAWVIFP